MISLLYLLIVSAKICRCAQEFVVYHAQHHEIQGARFGSTAVPLNCELQSVDSKLVSRRCIILPLYAATIETIKDAAFHHVAGILVSLPASNWSPELQKLLSELERELLASEITIPIYFVLDNEQLTAAANDVLEMSRREQSVGGLAALATIWSTSYRIVVQPAAAKNTETFHVTNIEGQLGIGDGRKLPVLLICAHYDAMSAVPVFSYGADSSGSSVVVLLELARLFSRLYAIQSSNPKFELVFLLSGGGNYNYLGTKRWLDHGSEDFSELALLDSIAHVICLEGLGSSNFAENLYVHLSRSPKEGSFSSKFIQYLNVAFNLHSKIPRHPNLSNVHFVHKKINLNQGSLAWEHERFALHRLPGFTLSAWPSAQVANRLRHSSLDGGPLYHIAEHGEKYTNRSTFRGSVDPKILARNVRVIAEALARVVFPSNLSSVSTNDTSFIASNWVSETGVAALLDFLVSRPRSVQLLEHRFKASTNRPHLFTASAHASAEKWPGLLGSLQHLMSTHLQRVRVSSFPFSSETLQDKAKTQKDPRSGKGKDERDAEFTESSAEGQYMRSSSLLATADFNVVLHSGMEPTTLTIYRLKSSMFDLTIAGLVALYLAAWYFVLEHFRAFDGFISRLCLQKPKVA
ncbi:tRNA (cytosine-5-)-methyltransferase ncl1 [Clonorchis sinensis]|uniref:BOS complex subunit NCLN n=1 Tax=Clonorchis sinensis TaxID=79923 RepID=A0A8T1MSQ6_CLOSI|nr:tRNA (cytosine-5-)-methyltransferase ncl1 [Clonorchis sinensis]